MAGKSYDGASVMEFSAALEGNDGERSFQTFLGEPSARALIERRPCLATTLDDFAGLAALPEGSLGRAYLRLARRDGIRVATLVEGQRDLPDEAERAPDALRRWYRDRMVASHDLLHVATGYDRDRPGEILLLAFTHAGTPKAVFRVAIGLGMLSVPLRWWPTFAIDVGRAWRRGRAAQVPRSTPWEELLPLSLVEVRRRLGIRPLAESHAGRIWRADPEGAWRRIPAAQAGG